MIFQVLQSKYALYVGFSYFCGCLSLSMLAAMVYFKQRDIKKHLKAQVN